MNTARVLSQLDQECFDYLRVKLQAIAGINLSAAKFDLVSGRLRKRLLELELDSFHDYVDYLKSLSKDHEEWEIFINSLTTNKTDFFREPEHFAMLVKEVEARYKNLRGEPLRIWSAAASTGEEPYTLAMVLGRLSKSIKFDFEIAASDIDTEVLTRASNGVYPKSKLSEIPGDYQRESVALGSQGLEGWIKIRKALKSHVLFQRCNLLEPPFPWMHRFDLIFCRNVLIYFSPETISKVVENLYEEAKPGALLVIGHSESLNGIRTRWQYVKPSLYLKKVK